VLGSPVDELAPMALARTAVELRHRREGAPATCTWGLPASRVGRQRIVCRPAAL